MTARRKKRWHTCVWQKSLPGRQQTGNEYRSKDLAKRVTSVPLFRYCRKLQLIFVIVYAGFEVHRRFLYLCRIEQQLRPRFGNEGSRGRWC